LRRPESGRFWDGESFWAFCLVSWLPVIVRGRPVLRRLEFSAASMLAPTADTFRQFLDQQTNFVFFITVYVGAGLIANDPPRKRLADLSLEAADPIGLRGWQARDSRGVPADGDLGAGHAAAHPAGSLLPATSRSCEATCI